MNRLAILAARACCAITAVANAASLHAELGLNAIVYRESGFSFQDAERWSLATGQSLFEYDSGFESIDAITMGPGNVLYAAGNNLGLITIVRYDTFTGTPLGSFFGGPTYDMSFGPDGHLYTAATDFSISEPSGAAAVLRRFDALTGAPLGEVNLGPNRHIGAIDFSADGQFMHVLHGPTSYLAGQGADRVSTYALSTLFSPLPPNTPPVEAAGFFVGDMATDMSLGADGQFYITDFTADGVLRYAADGQFVDEFVNQYVTDLHFIDGRILGLSRAVFGPTVTPNKVLAINPATGQVASLIDAAADPHPQPIFFIGIAPFVIPEPGTASLILLAGAAILARRTVR